VIEMVAIKPQSAKKACSLCGNRIRGKAFVYYDEMPNLNDEPRECIPLCKGCDVIVSVYEQTFSIWYGLFRIESLRRIPRETVKAEEKLRRKLRKLRKH
jgi:hypothetical protein